MDLIVQDFEQSILSAANGGELIVNLEKAMQKGLLNNQSSGINSWARK